ncbi:hypothetical protein SLS54_009708 [Diplodia seriata]
MTDSVRYLLPFYSQMLTSYENYADDCYADVSDLGSCSAFIKAHIPTKTDTNASCPFGKGICKLEHDNIVFDTGYLDSHFDFGINAPPTNMIAYSDKVDDPWYSAHLNTIKTNVTYGQQTSKDYYAQDEPVSVLACYVSEQYCNPNLPSDVRCTIADAAKGISDMNLLPWLKRPSNVEEKHLCNNQKIRNAEYFNFSVFGLSFTLALGSLVIFLSYTVEPLLGWLQRRRNWDSYARLEWITNETLQLQRLAHEEAGLETWEGCADNVPVTRHGERLAVLDLHDPEHPRLKVPPRTFAGV